MANNLLIPHGFEANYTVGFARGLTANGVRFVVVSDDDTAPRLAAAGIPQRNLRRGLSPARPARKKLANLLGYYARLLWTVAAYRGATIHFSGLLNGRIILLDGLILPLWFRCWAGRYVHTSHNALPHGREQSAVFRAAYRWIYRFPHTIVTHTAKVAEQLQAEFGVDPSRIAVISIGLNEEIPRTELSVEDSRRRLGLPSHGAVALFFGKVEPYKGVDLLVEAWTLLKPADARLVIVGGCSEAGHARVIRQAMADSPRSATMEWRERFVPNDEVAVWLRACDVVVMPYRNIYQSGVVFLCKRFGVPIVATNVGSMAEFVDPDSGLIAASNDSVGFADALDRFFARRANFDRETIARRSAKYAWTLQCAAIKHLYQ